MNSQCLISFGSNLGDRYERIAAAAKIISDSPLVVADSFSASRLFETPPIGGPGGQEPFLNAVAAFDTTASAREVLAYLQETENTLGRERRQRWGARSIDLDVVLHGELIGGGTGLVVPHPRYTARQFVLQPARDVASHYRDPRFGWSIAELSDHLSRGAASLALAGGGETIRRELCQRLRIQHGITTILARDVGQPTSTGQPARTADLDLSDAWVSDFVPSDLPSSPSAVAPVYSPRLIARIQQTTTQTSWPAPHQMWPSGWKWPEYRLEVDDLDWAVSEIVSALTSMRCPTRPMTDDGDWWS